MQHMIREDERGMLSFREALWLQERNAPEAPAIRESIARALMALADRLDPVIVEGKQERRAAVRAA